MKQKEYIIGEGALFAVETLPESLRRNNPIFLVHGSWGASWMWKKYIEFFVKNGWRTVAFDLRGHGKSGGTVEGATMEDYASDSAEVVKELAMEKPIIIGHSMGGLVAMMYAALSDAGALVVIDGSPPLEIQKESKEVEYPASYTIMDAGMPADPAEIMKALPDLLPEQVMMMKDMLGVESGVARSERKRGVSVPKDKLTIPRLFLGAELGKSVPFGISPEVTRAAAEYYNGTFIHIEGATHPGILMGLNAKKAAEAIVDWLEKI